VLGLFPVFYSLAIDSITASVYTCPINLNRLEIVMLNEIPGLAAVMVWMQKIYDSGCSAKYNHVNETVGFKWYRYASEAFQTHTMQAIAAEQGWGPQVGKMVKAGVHYGYLTERVIPLGEMIQQGKKPNYRYGTWEGWLKSVGLIDIESMQREYKMWFADMHSGNVGFLVTDESKGVILDFGGVSYRAESPWCAIYDERRAATEKNVIILS
jgi:hypothetical protein